MAKRIYISFAIEDENYRDLLVGQARAKRSPFEFSGMPVKYPRMDIWKTRARTGIKGCKGVIVLVSKNTLCSQGQLWEVRCAKEENVPVRGVYVSEDNRPAQLPQEFEGVAVVSWTWDNIGDFLRPL
jgi:hypothetical protein